MPPGGPSPVSAAQMWEAGRTTEVGPKWRGAPAEPRDHYGLGAGCSAHPQGPSPARGGAVPAAPQPLVLRARGTPLASQRDSCKCFLQKPLPLSCPKDRVGLPHPSVVSQAPKGPPPPAALPAPPHLHRGPHRHPPRSIRGQPRDGRGPPCPVPRLLPTHQAPRIPGGCSRPCLWPVPSCHGNQAPPEPSWCKELWVSNMSALLNDHILLSSASLERDCVLDLTAAGCPQMQLRCGPEPSWALRLGTARPSRLGLASLSTGSGLHCQLRLPLPGGPAEAVSTYRAPGMVPGTGVTVVREARTLSARNSGAGGLLWWKGSWQHVSGCLGRAQRQRASPIARPDARSRRPPASAPQGPCPMPGASRVQGPLPGGSQTAATGLPPWVRPAQGAQNGGGAWVPAARPSLSLPTSQHNRTLEMPPVTLSRRGCCPDS